MRRLLASLVLALVALATAPARAQDPPPDAVLAELPFLASDEPNRIYVDLAPPDAERRMEMLLDTGANFSVFSPHAARQMGVSVRRDKADPYRRKTLLGRDLQFYIDVRSSDTGTRMGWDFRLLGGNFLEEYVVELDFGARRVRFIDPKRWSVPETAGPDEAVLPMKLTDLRPLWSIAVNGVETPVLVDTGAPPALLLAGPRAEAAGLASREIEGLATSTTLGPVQTRLSDAARVTIGPFELEDVPVLVTPRGLYNVAGPGDSVLGYDLLAEFTVRFDYPHGRAWLRRRPDARRTLFGGDWRAWREDGVLLVPRGSAHEVLLLDSAGVAARRGLRLGDRIDGRAASAVLADLREGRELVVVRELDGVGVDTVLEAVPVEPAPSSATATP